jgi:hypothetical protein
MSGKAEHQVACPHCGTARIETAGNDLAARGLPRADGFIVEWQIPRVPGTRVPGDPAMIATASGPGSLAPRGHPLGISRAGARSRSTQAWWLS